MGASTYWSADVPVGIGRQRAGETHEVRIVPHAIGIHENGGPDVLKYEAIEVGDPGPGESGMCPARPQLPHRSNRLE